MTRIAFLFSFLIGSLQLTACSDRPTEAAEPPVRAQPGTEASAMPSRAVKTAESPAPAPDKPAATGKTDQSRETNNSPQPPSPEKKPATSAQAPATKEENGGPPSHQLWDEQLRKYVSNSGQVDYKAWIKEKEQLEKYLSELAAHPVRPNWSRAEQMAYWINAYNAFTVKLILDNYPLGSITDLHGGKPWDVRWIELGDRTYSLNNIENDILRPRYQEPRIHFALNCAARSCPPLLNRAWTADNLERHFEQQTKAFINDPQYNQLAPEAVQISRIFDWYAADFDDLIAFLNRYASGVTIRPDAKVSYLEYDWGLNEK